MIYKGRGALRVCLKKGQLDVSGSLEKMWPSTNKGCIFLHFCNAVGRRDYDWDNKVVVALNEHEVADLIICLTRGAKTEFFHDRNLGKPDQGKFTKKVTFQQTDDGNAIMANCFVKNDGEQIKMNSVPIHKNEAVALGALLQAALPQIMGW